MRHTISEFFRERIWTIRVTDLPKRTALKLMACRVVALTARFFVKNRCSLRASALTYYTLLSIVPIAALLFGIAKGYGFDVFLKAKLRTSMVGQEKAAEWIISFAESALHNASGGLIAGVGVVVLFWTALNLLASIEGAFNDIWGVKQGRSWIRKLSDYLTMLVLCPILMIILVSSSAFFLTQLRGLLTHLPYTAASHAALGYASKLLPVVLAWGAFTFIYLFIPNTKVKFRAALIAGGFAGILYVIVQYAYMFAQGVLTGYNAVYGSFAALPFFLIWLQASWSIVLLGAQIAFSVQNVNVYELAPGDGPASGEYHALCALRVMRTLCSAFEEHRGPASAEELSERLEIPIRVMRSVLYKLSVADMILEFGETKGEKRYQVAFPPREITPVLVFRKLADLGEPGYLSAQTAADRADLEKLWTAAEQAPENRPMGGK